MSEFITEIPNENNKTRKKLINLLYSASEEELNFYDRLITFANDETAELKKNIMLKKIY